MHLNRLLEHRGLTQSQIARRLGIRQPHVSDLKRYRLNRFSAERLMEFLVTLGQAEICARLTQENEKAPTWGPKRLSRLVGAK
jgi:predicted XRE-type DNA-binding protein